MKKRLFAMLLSLVMTFIMVTPAALAGGEAFASGPSYIVDDIYYSLYVDDAGDGWYYTASNRTLTLDGFDSRNVGLYAFYTEENLFIELVGENTCSGEMKSFCWPVEDDRDGGNIYIVGSGSLNLEKFTGRDFYFCSGTVNTNTSGYATSSGRNVFLYADATLNLNENSYGGTLYSLESFVMNGGVLNVVNGQRSSLWPNRRYDFSGGVATFRTTNGDDALKLDADTYGSLMVTGCSITDLSGGATVHYTFGDMNVIRLAANEETKLDNVKIVGVGSGESFEDPRPAPGTPDVPDTPDKPDTPDTPDMPSGTLGALKWGITENNSAVAAEMGLPVSYTLTLSGNGAEVQCPFWNDGLWTDSFEYVTEVVIEEGVSGIGDCAFVEHINLITVYIPTSVDHIGGDAFTNCPLLSDIYYAGTEAQWDEILAKSVPAESLYAVNVHFGSSAPETPDVPVVPQPPVTGNPFTDVKTSDYFYEPVLWAVENGITSGTGNGQFSPNNPCTRGQVVTFLWRAAGEPEPTSSANPFSDVKSSDYFYKAVLWAVENGITTGIGDGKFGPEAGCTRGQVVTFQWRAAGEPSVGSASNPFVDVKGSDYYYAPVLWALENSITTGVDATHFGADATCSRGQIVTFLYRGN